MQSTVYLDNSATTPLSDAAKEKIRSMLDVYGNPSSLHTLGKNAEGELRSARSAVLHALGSRRREDSLIFTSCGTEATALAFLGCANAKARRDALRVLITDSEHPSVSENARLLERLGFELVRIPTKGGILDLAALESALDKKIFLASFMLVNNETGALYRVGDAFRRIKEVYPEAITHCDAVQGFLKVEFTPSSLCADLVTVSGHKLHAPKGVGALFVSGEMIKKKKLVPFLAGGGQESGFRSGTENTLGIAAFGASVTDIESKKADIRQALDGLYSYAVSKLCTLEGVQINVPAGEHVSHIINITLPNIKSETVLHFLSADGIFVSSGSACSSHSHTPSQSLIAFGLTAAQADCSLRISFSHYNTKDDIDKLILSLSCALNRLVRITR